MSVSSSFPRSGSRISRDGLVGLGEGASRGTDSRPRILCVDDEEDVLDTLRRALSARFVVDTAPGGEAALELIDREATYAAVLSDRRMPGMDGLAFLAEFRLRSPDSVRILLTGQLDLELAIAAVNEAQIFRLLKKPCRRETLIGTLDEAAALHHASTRDHSLREQAVRGSIEMVRAVIGILRPDLGQRGDRIAGYVTELVSSGDVGDAWSYETAATLAPVAALETLSQVSASAGEHGAHDPRPAGRSAHFRDQVLSTMPGFEHVREMVRFSEQPFDGSGASPDGIRGEEIPFGARVLRVAMDFETLASSGASSAEAIATLRERHGSYDPHVLDRLERLLDPSKSASARHEIPLESLESGMVLAEDLYTDRGVLFVRKGQEMTSELLDRIRRIKSPGGLDRNVKVIVPCISVFAH